MARAIVEATTHFDDADVVAKVSPGLGEAMAARRSATLETAARRARLVGRASSASSPSRATSASTRPSLDALGVDAASAAAPRATSRASTALVLPGGESTTISHLLDYLGARAVRSSDWVATDRPTLGTCAGLVLLAARSLDGRADQVGFGGARHLGAPQRLRPPDRFSFEATSRSTASARSRGSSSGPRGSSRSTRASRCSATLDSATAVTRSSRRARLLGLRLPPRAHRRRSAPRPVRWFASELVLATR